MIKGVIFDMDGLMIDTEKLLTRFWCEAAQFYGWNITKEHVLGIRSLAAKYAEPHLKGILGDDFNYFDVRTKRIELMNAYIAENGIEKKKGLDELLDYLDEVGLKKAVATATDRKRTKMYLTSIGVYDRFDKIVCGDMIKNGKPAPDIYITAAGELELPCGECMALEDSPNGIRSAFTAGCVPVMIPDLSQPDDETAKIMYEKCDDLSQVIDVLKKLNS